MDEDISGYAIAYLRSAVENQKAISRQEEEIRKYCDDNKLKLLNTFSDIGPSGISNMRGWINMLHFLKQNKGLVSTLVVTNYDRISRNMTTFLSEEKTLRDYLGVTIQSVNGQNSERMMKMLSHPLPNTFPGNKRKIRKNSRRKKK